MDITACPICNKTPIVGTGIFPGYFVECSCGVFPFPPAPTKQEAISRWNERANKKPAGVKGE